MGFYSFTLPRYRMGATWSPASAVLGLLDGPFVMLYKQKKTDQECRLVCIHCEAGLICMGNRDIGRT
jgi:hypothetical protein